MRSYGQSKLANLMTAFQLDRIAEERGWNLMSNAAHPGFTSTNLQTAGPSLGTDKPRRMRGTNIRFLPSQEVEQGAEPMLFAATDPAARAAGYYGPAGVLELVGPTGDARPPRKARDIEVARRLWTVSEQLTGTRLPATV